MYDSSCDSLSNLYLWHIKYSRQRHWWKRTSVVIRFQICIFDILNTAEYLYQPFEKRCDSLSNLYLWHIKYSAACCEGVNLFVVIRFQICIFDILNTATYFCHTFIICCDSLSNLYLWHIKYSYFSHIATKYSIVIRFQICIFDILNTALAFRRYSILPLWFAFKFVSLTY